MSVHKRFGKSVHSPSSPVRVHLSRTKRHLRDIEFIADVEVGQVWKREKAASTSVIHSVQRDRLKIMLLHTRNGRVTTITAQKLRLYYSREESS